MSATINEGKMSFSVFGRGYDDTRVDSGEGAVEDYNRYAMGICSGCFDSTGQYLWLGCYGNGHAAGLLKYDMDDDFTEVAHSVPTSSAATVVLHASNDNNNLGLAIQGSNWWVFDLTDDTVIASGTDASIPNYIDWGRVPYDVALDGTKFLITLPRSQKGTQAVLVLDYSDGTFTRTVLSGYQRAGGAFITPSLIYLFYPPEWFYQDAYISGVTPTGTQAWGYQTEGNFTKISMMGFGKKGRLYVPSLVYSSWRLGEYNGLKVPDFETPKPIKVIGKFASKPSISRFEFSHEKKNVGFTTDIGVFVSDFEDMEKISDSSDKVYAVSGNYIVVDKGYWDSSHPSSIGIYKYR